MAGSVEKEWKKQKGEKKKIQNPKRILHLALSYKENFNHPALMFLPTVISIVIEILQKTKERIYLLIKT